MKRRWLPLGSSLLSFLLLLAPGLHSLQVDLDVRASNGAVTIRAQAAPLSEVLDRLSRETGLKVVYEGPRPSQRVTTSIQALPETEALLRLLEGLGLNYALQMDASGQRVVVLVVAENAPSVPAPPGAAPARNAPARPAEPVEAEDFAPPGMAGAEAPHEMDEEPGFPPGGGFAPGPAPPSAVGSAGSGNLPSSPFPSDPEIPAPSFPEQASQPAPPSFPREASNPPPR